MAVAYLLAHFDDEYAALPLIWATARRGVDQHFLYLADYRAVGAAERRHRETRSFLQAQAVDPGKARHIGRGEGAFDGEIYRALPTAFAAAASALDGIQDLEGLVVPAWEGGHMDHDVCALIAVRYAQRRAGLAIHQFSLYQGHGLAGPFLRASSPLAENGPSLAIPIAPAERLRWMRAVSHFRSQAYAWSGIWPAMLAAHGFGRFAYQRLEPERVDARPHAGRLFYERMFRVPYEALRAAADAALPTPSPCMITRKPAIISP
jgi:hypothetical protein